MLPFQAIGSKEFLNFKHNALNYFKHLSGTFLPVEHVHHTAQTPKKLVYSVEASILVKVVGLYRVHVEDPTREITYRIVAMENLTYSKGSPNESEHIQVRFINK